MTKRMCKFCKSEFEIPSNSYKKTLCSKECRSKFMSQGQRIRMINNNPMKMAEVVDRQKISRLGKNSGEKHHMWKGGTEITVDGYRVIYAPKHPMAHKGKYQEHRIIMEKHIGRYLTRNEIVHHKDGNKLNNKIENLEIMTRAEHCLTHKPSARKLGLL